MVSFAKLHIIRQRIRKKYKNIGSENFLLSIMLFITIFIKTWKFSHKHLIYYRDQGVEEVSIHCKKITLSSFLVIVLVTSKYTKLFLFSFEHFRLRMKDEIDGVVVHSLGFSAEGSGFEFRPRPHFVSPFFLKKKYSPIHLLKIHAWGK